MKEFKLNLRVFFTLGLWFRNYKTNKHWDKILRNMLENNPKIIKQTDHTIIVNDYTVWVSNKWYAFGTSYYNGAIPNNLLPSRKTAILLNDLLNPPPPEVPEWYKEFETKVKVVNSPLYKAMKEEE